MGENIEATYIICNKSTTPVYLPDMTYDYVSFHLFHDNVRVPFESRYAILHTYELSPDIALEVGQCCTFGIVFSERMWKMPEKPGEYRLCARYVNRTTSRGGIDFWTGEIESNCVPLKLVKPQD